MPKTIPIADLIPLLPLRVVCRIWDSRKPDTSDFINDLKSLGIHDVCSAEEAVNALYAKFTVSSSNKGQNLLSNFEKILRLHLNKD